MTSAAALYTQTSASDERSRSIDALLDSTLHPALGGISLWRASQLGRANGRTVDTGYPSLSAELPGAGWPRGALMELLVQQTGVGELRLLAPALAAVANRPIAILQPPLEPNVHGLAYAGIPPNQILLVKGKTSSDVLWAAEQTLKAGTCGALLVWQTHVRAESLRRLHLAAKTSETLFVLIRPLSAAQDPSPAELRLAVRPAAGGVAVDILKRKGPAFDGSLMLELAMSPVLLSRHGPARRAVPVATASLEPVEA
jgi:protein ImuA